MKAQTFLEWFRNEYPNELHYSDDSCSDSQCLMGYFDEIQKLADLYSRPFKPAMITELFEGIEKKYWLDHELSETVECGCGQETTNTWRGDILEWCDEKRKDELLKNSSFYKVRIKYVAWEYKGKTIYRTGDKEPKPHTLDRLISNCEHRGIGLEWKAEIAKEYFQ